MGNKERLAQLLREKQRRKRERRLFSYYPKKGPLRRELYKKHTSFFSAGKNFRERLALAANRVGKTEGIGGYEMALHLTGLYPDWWEGVRYKRPVKAWAAGDTSKTVRDIIQEKLLGNYHDMGTGLIPKECIIKTTPKVGTPEAIETVYVSHVSGGVSQLTLKSYDQKRESFQGTKIDIIWLDEEPPQDIYTECLLRTMGTGDEENKGMMMLTFTPLRGMSDVVMSFLPNGKVEESTEGTKFVVMATWDDAPHLSDEEKAELYSAMPPHQRDARSKGVPQLGSGAIYPVPESDIVVDDFAIPDHWPRAYGLDVGWNKTAAVWGAVDPETGTVFLYSEHYRGEAEPVVHVEAIKARGDWIPGVIDPAARGRSQRDGGKLMDDYINLGLDIEAAFNGVESGIYDTWSRMSAGRLKVFKSLTNWLSEFRLYRRDDKGRIVKANDHLMDTTRYLIVSGLDRAITKPIKKEKQSYRYASGSHGTGWMG